MNQLKTLAEYLAGQFDNQEQALNQPTWYVSLRLWLRPVKIFHDESIALFAEQASVVNLHQPYRQRILRLKSGGNLSENLEVEHYMFKDVEPFRGAGSNQQILKKITLENLEFLPNCTLKVETQIQKEDCHFRALPIQETPCTFTYQNKKYQVRLGFEVNPDNLLTYDKGIDPETGKALWGALLGPYHFHKRQDFSGEIDFN